jgi:hypothetical protein
MTDDDAAKAYAQYLFPHFQSVKPTLDRLGALSTAVGQNVALVQQPNWRMGWDAVLDQLDSAGRAMQQYGAVPPILQSLQRQVESLGRTLTEMVAEFREGTKTINADLIR